MKKTCLVCGSKEFKTDVFNSVDILEKVFGSFTKIERVKCMKCGAIYFRDYDLNKWGNDADKLEVK